MWIMELLDFDRESPPLGDEGPVNGSTQFWQAHRHQQRSGLSLQVHWEYVLVAGLLVPPCALANAYGTALVDAVRPQNPLSGLH